MLRVAQWARERLGAYQVALATTGGCDTPQTGRLPIDGYKRLFSASGAAFPANRGAGACAAAKAAADKAAAAKEDAKKGGSPSAEDTVFADNIVTTFAADAAADAAEPVRGGAPKRRPPPKRHVVVDTLNILHVLGKKPSVAAIVETIDEVAPVLRNDTGFPGRIMFVVKDRESAHLEKTAQAAYNDAAIRNRVFVYAVERYRKPPCVAAVNEPGAQTAATRHPRHSAHARDDFYASVLAKRWDAPILTADRYRDFAEWPRTLPPFHVDEYSYSAPPDAPPTRYYVNPKGGAFDRMKPPDTIRPCRGIPGLLKGCGRKAS